MSFKVEIAGLADAEVMAELHFVSHTVSFAPFASQEWLASRSRAEYLAQWREFLGSAESDARSQAWKVTDGEVIVGMVKVGPMNRTEAQLSSMHAHPDFQRRGIGSLLMTAATNFLCEAGFSTAILGVIQANTPARAIYERNGWTVRELHETGVEGVPIAVYELDVMNMGRG